MAKSLGVDELIGDALKRALADPVPRKLHGTRANPGVFLASSAVAKAAAERCLQLGLIEARGEQTSRTKSVPLYGVTPAGVAYLLQHEPAQQVLASACDGMANLTRAVAECQQTMQHVGEHVARLTAVTCEAAARLAPPDVEALLAAARPTPAAASSPPTDASREIQARLLDHLRQHKRQSPLRPLDLPQALRWVRTVQPALTLGQFHDLLRRMADAKQVRLTPFTQALYLLSEPECALLVGREIMYYVEAF